MARPRYNSSSLQAMKKILALISLGLALGWGGFEAGARTNPAQSAPEINVSPLPQTASYSAGFSPHGQALDLVLKGIHSAQQEILVAAYVFTSQPIANALLQAKERGVVVKIIVDENEAEKKYSRARFLQNRHVEVRVNGTYSIHHNKFMVLDGRHVETGSFNYSASAASRNAENVLLLWNVPALAQQYQQEWSRLWEESVPLTTYQR